MLMANSLRARVRFCKMGSVLFEMQVTSVASMKRDSFLKIFSGDWWLS